MNSFTQHILRTLIPSHTTEALAYERREHSSCLQEEGSQAISSREHQAARNGKAQAGRGLEPVRQAGKVLGYSGASVKRDF